MKLSGCTCNKIWVWIFEGNSGLLKYTIYKFLTFLASAYETNLVFLYIYITTPIFRTSFGSNNFSSVYCF